MKLLYLFNRWFLRLSRTPLQILRCASAVLALGLNGVVIVFEVFFFV
jgi:hypothetical protein